MRALISRRRILLAGGSSAALTLYGCAVPAPAPPSATSQDIALRVDRLTWGVNDSTVSAVRAQGFDAWLRTQLRSPADPALPPDVQTRIASMTISRESMEALVLRMEEQRKAADAVASDEAKKAARQRYQQEMNALAREAASRHLLRALYSPHQLRERMSWFWLNHFSVHQSKQNLRAMLGDYEDTIRSRALGRFRDLLGAVAHHPAMLRYLDNEQNAGGRINENYARELMELHTLGVEGGYSQTDVQELARVLTGVGVNLGNNPPNVRRDLQSFHVRRGLFEFNPNRHDFGAKKLLGEPISNRGLAELDEALDRLSAHASTSRFISRKLATYWMADDPDPRVVDAMAGTFMQTGGDIAAVLATMFAAPEFWRAHKFKDPMRYVASAVRLAQDDRPIMNTAPMIGWLSRLAQPLYGRPTPDGYPLDSRSWSSAGQMETRFEIAKAIGSISAGLFHPDDAAARDSPAFPQLATPLYYGWRESTLGAATRAALAQASSPQEWNTYLLSSPEFMQG